MDDRVLIMTYESLVARYLKHHILYEIIHFSYLRRLTQGMRCNEIIGQYSGNIREGVPDDFLLESILT